MQECRRACRVTDLFPQCQLSLQLNQLPLHSCHLLRRRVQLLPHERCVSGRLIGLLPVPAPPLLQVVSSC
jgi:hypothetical protein